MRKITIPKLSDKDATFVGVVRLAVMGRPGWRSDLAHAKTAAIILDKLEAASDVLELQDPEHEMLAAEAKLADVSIQAGNRDYLRCLIAILEAEAS